MRLLVAAPLAALALGLLAPSPASAEDAGPPVLELEVGGEKVLGGYRPLCDDPAVARFSTDGRGALQGVKVGETTCSVSSFSPLGPRQVYRVVVVPKAPPGKAKRGR